MIVRRNSFVYKRLRVFGKIFVVTSHIFKIFTHLALDHSCLFLSFYYGGIKSTHFNRYWNMFCNARFRFCDIKSHKRA